MPTLEIDGRNVEVDEAFRSLSPDEQARAVDEIAVTLRINAKPQNPFYGKSDDDARRYISSLPEDQRDAARNAWADAYVQREREQGGIMQGIDNSVRALARGTPIGSFLDEASALTTWATGGDYDEALAYQRAKDRAFDDANPYGSIGLQVAGGVGSGLGAIGLLGKGSQSASLGGRIADGAKAGAAAGGIYGFGLGEGGVENRLYEAAKGGALGAGIGAVAAPVADAGARAVGYLLDRGRPVPRDIGGFNRRAIRTIAEAAPPDAARRLAGLTEEGMLADVPGLSDIAGGMAATQTAGGRIVSNAIANRAGGAAKRIVGAVNETLGPPENLPQKVQAIEAAYGPARRAAYQQFEQTPVPYTRELEGVLRRLKNEPGVLRTARRLANLNEGIGTGGTRQFFADIADDGTVKITRVPNAVEWDYVKRSLDDLAKGGAADDQRIYGAYAKMVRNAVDNALSPDDPAQSIYKKARSLSSDEKGLKDAIEMGKEAFRRDISPDEMAAEIATLTKPQQQAYKAGARQFVRNIMGNAATKFGENSDAAALRTLSTEYAKEKLRLIGSKGSGIENRLRSESAFAATAQNVLNNSKTAARQSAQELLPKGAMPNRTGDNWSGTTGVGLLSEGARRAMNALRGGAQRETAEKIVTDMAVMLTQQGQRASDIARALTDYGKRLRMTDRQKKAWRSLITVAVRGSQQAALSAASSSGQGSERLQVTIRPQ